ncbi:MAG: tetratricopeptide repeat protein [Methanothrix sp.]|nr:MAG: tetratricopeptide repeat protein [Methanothrix sp.]
MGNKIFRHDNSVSQGNIPDRGGKKMVRMNIIAAILLLIGSAHAGNITACASGCDYDSIQEAIYGARPHDAIVLFSGTYNESVFLTKPLNFTGTDTGSGEPDVQGGLFTNGFEFALEGFSFSSIKEAPSAGDASPEKMNATTWFGRGYALSAKGEYEQAAKAYDEALKLDPGLAYAWIQKGKALYQLGRYNESTLACQLAVRIDPNCTSAWNSLGASLFMQGKNDEAIDACNRAIELEADYDSAWNSKGYAFMSLGKYDESVKSFDQALKINEKHKYAWNGKGQSLNSLKRYDEALQAFERTIELDSSYSPPWNNKGYVLYVLKKYEEAIDAFDEAIRLDRNSSAAWNNKGLALAALGKYDEAISAYDEALRRDSTNEAAFKNREDTIKTRGLAGKSEIPAVTPKAIAPAAAPAVNLPTIAAGTEKEENTTSITDLLYADDFSSNLNWRDSWASQVNKDGRLCITITKRQYDSLRNPTIKAFKDCIIEANATLEHDSQDSAFGLLFRHAGNNFYRFKISGKGEFGFDLLANRRWAVLVPWTKSAAINTGKASNQIRAECRGNRFTFFVNGVNLGEYLDDTFPNSGKVGLFADSASSAGTQVSFDNLKIWALTA